MKSQNIYLCGVGGQGIGLLADVLARACLEAGYSLIGCDTHGLAQRGGTVVSHLRLGSDTRTPLIAPGQADLVAALERLEALRAIHMMLRDKGGAVIYYDTVYQPIHVRLGLSPYPSAVEVAQAVTGRAGRLERVSLADLPDPRMQNVALLGRLAALRFIDGVTPNIVEKVLSQTLPKAALADNLAVFKRAQNAS